MRIAVGVLFLWDLGSLAPDWEAFYSDQGLLPRTALASLEDPAHWSLALIWGNLAGIWVFFGLTFLSGLSLLFGWRTRTASFLCFLLTSSLQSRWEIVPGWDAELRLLFFYGAFLPWGRAFSLDSRNDNTKNGPYLSWATFAWRIQLAALYVGAGLQKGGAYWSDGTAVECALHSDGYATAAANWLLELLQPYPEALVWLNDGVPLLEILVPLMFFFPSGLVQSLAALVLMLMHVGFGIFLDLDLFSWVSCAVLLCFVPSGLWPERPAMVEKMEIWKAGLLSWAATMTVLSTWHNLPEGKNFLNLRANFPVRWFGLVQRWSMFVPPPVDGGWHVCRGRTRAGQWVDLMHLKESVDEQQPKAIHASYPTVRWYLYCANHFREGSFNQRYRRAAANFLKLRWEQHFPDLMQQIVEVELVYWHRRYRPQEGYTQPKRRLLWRQFF